MFGCYGIDALAGLCGSFGNEGRAYSRSVRLRALGVSLRASKLIYFGLFFLQF
jgi:hypothetical protein